MRKAILALVFVLAVVCCAEHAHASPSISSSGSTTGWGDDSVNQSLAEEFAKCAAFNDIAAQCVKLGAREQDKKIAARHEDLAKRFYKGTYLLAGQDFTRTRIQFHNTSMRRNAGHSCADFPKLEQQHRTRCDDTFKRLPRKLQ